MTDAHDAPATTGNGPSGPSVPGDDARGRDGAGDDTGDGAGGLTHVREDGSAHMVDVTGKAVTTRVATARSSLRTRPDVVARLADGSLPKGEALGTARIAGIMAAKQTSTLIPLCHPLPIGRVTVDFEVGDAEVVVHASVSTKGVTGVEMEALTAATVAALTLYDMVKAVDPLAVVGETSVTAKQGGKSGDWTRAERLAARQEARAGGGQEGPA